MAPHMKRKSPATGLGPKPGPKRSKLGIAGSSRKSIDGGEAKQKSKPTNTPAALTEPAKTNSVSLLVMEQPAFPRGGGATLTPLEQRKIQIRATRDALAEGNGTAALFEGLDQEEDLSDIEKGAKDLPPTTKLKNGTRKVKAQRNPKKISAGGRSLRIEGLKHKGLSVGTLVLGEVLQIDAQRLTIALPNNLVGHVSLTSISQKINERIEKLIENGDNDHEENEGSAIEEVNLGEYFRIGQYLRTSVISLDGSPATNPRPKKKIELSIQPELANAGLERSDLTVGCTVQASVLSVEDHGLIVDLGIGKDDIKGFVPADELDGSFDLEMIKPGAVLLCIVVAVDPNGRSARLSANPAKFSTGTSKYILRDAPSVNTFLPGTAVEILLSEVTPSGLIGKIMGMLNATADVLHSGACHSSMDLQDQYTAGKRIKARVLFQRHLTEEIVLGVSVLAHILSFQKTTPSDDAAEGVFLSQVISGAQVVRVEPGLGVYLQLSQGRLAFAHVSRLSDQKVETISATSGAYRIGSSHKIRILDFNPVDSLFLVSLQESIIKRPFLRVDDIKVGEVVKGIIKKLLIGEKGIRGVVVELSEDIEGFVSEHHLSDTILQHPEKKFREGATVSCRVLSKDLKRRQVRLTLKKSLVNSDQKVWQSYPDISVGDSTPGTLVKVDPFGALVEFYGGVKGFLPVAEMSEAYIKDATEHFQVGQVVTVSALSVDEDRHRLTLSCRDLSSGPQSVESVLLSLEPCSFVNGTVFEKSEDDLLIRLDESNAIARLSLDHVTDGSLRKRQSALSKIRVGQKLQELMLFEVRVKRRLVDLCNRPSLIKARKEGTFLGSFEDLREGLKLTGFVSNITSDGIFVGFASGITGLIPKTQIPEEISSVPDFGMTRLQTVTATVSTIDYKSVKPRFWLTMKDSKGVVGRGPHKMSIDTDNSPRLLSDPVDQHVKSRDDLNVGTVLNVRITSVKETQLNIEVAKDVQGRIDVSELFDDWDEIKDRKKPLRKYSSGETLTVKILGAHDARNHRFLPISHRTGKTPLLELSAKRSVIENPDFKSLTLSDMKVGSTWLAFVNNIVEDCLWVTISPSVRGRIRAMDVSDDLSLAGDLAGNFPFGSALRVQVLSVDEDKNRLDLTGRQGTFNGPMTMQDISKGMILPGRITKVSERQLLVQLSDNLVGAVDLIDMADDYSIADPSRHQKNEIIRVYVLGVDAPNKKILLSIRPSKVMSSSLPVVDPEITSTDQLTVHGVFRGFISNVTDQGVFVILGHSVTALVRISHLTDGFLKEWKDHFQRDQLVKGKILSIDKENGRIQMSLRDSVLRPEWTPPLTFSDLRVGDIITAKVVKVETFGVFILVDNSENVRGLCHRSEIAGKWVEDASSLFSEGDPVKAKVLKIDSERRRINFGMKAAYFTEETEQVEALGDVDGGSAIDARNESDDQSIGDSGNSDDDLTELHHYEGEDVLPTDSKAEILKDEPKPQSIFQGLRLNLNPSSITATGSIKRTSYASDTEDERSSILPNKKKRRAAIQADRTGDLDLNGPQSAEDFERLLLSDSDSSLLWLQYMAFYLDLGDVDQARTIGERALKSIGLAQDAEKLNVWIALLNLENTYGDEEGRSVRATLERAVEYNDPQEIYSRLVSIYIQSGKHELAEALFHNEILKKFGHQDPGVWINYATFLFNTAEEPERARDLLAQALNTLPAFTHFNLISKFAQLEFRSKKGVPERGRTIFEGLLASFPKRVDLYNVMLDMEMKLGQDGNGNEENIRAVFERIFSGGTRLKPKQARHFFKRWLAFEESQGDERRVEQVKARAAEYVKEATTDGKGT